MNKQDIINYVCETPANTNRAVLTSMLNNFITEASEGTETFQIIMPAQYVTITDDDVEVTDVDMTGLNDGDKLLFEILVEDNSGERVTFRINYGDGEAHASTEEVIGATEGGLYVTVKKKDETWKLKVTDGSDYTPGSYIIKIVGINILELINAYPQT